VISGEAMIFPSLVLSSSEFTVSLPFETTYAIIAVEIALLNAPKLTFMVCIPLCIVDEKM
jgi:hypothetical protein